MSTFINPFTDWGFKYIFGQEANKDILICFLNELLKGERHITDLEYLDKEKLGSTIDDRCLIYDVYCKTDTGEHIVVEMQNKGQAYFVDRSLYYMSKALIEQGERGRDWEFKISAVYGVFFMNFSLQHVFGDKFRTDLILADRDTGKQISDKIRCIYLQLPAFKKTESECTTLFDKIIYTLIDMNVFEQMPFKAENYIFSRLEEVAKTRALTREEKWQYDHSLKVYRDNVNVLRYAISEGMAKGMEEGMAQGMAQGMAKGMEEGIAKGMTEEKMRNAKCLIANGVALDVVVASLGLTDEQIAALQ